MFFTPLLLSAMHVGRWVDLDDVDHALVAAYSQAPELSVDAGVGKTTVVVNDAISHHMVVIASGMFPFSTMPNSQIRELIDYIDENALVAKELNVILSFLSQIQARPNSNPSEEVKRLSSSVLMKIMHDIPTVLEGTGIDTGAESDFMKKLNTMAGDGKKRGLAMYLPLVKTKLLEYYKGYILHLKEYFEALQHHHIVNDGSVAFAQTAIGKLTEVAEIMNHTEPVHFSDAVAAFQSVARFQDNAHKLVHSEDILLYCVTSEVIGLSDVGVRFFTKYDMCEICEDIVWNYAHRGDSPFVVLSREPYPPNSRERNNTGEAIMLKLAI
ncbi:MAG: hypothetical protein LBI95_01770 [Holosporales bacterium]|nr:hypothetical protein [Holosporales bacterium]